MASNAGATYAVTLLPLHGKKPVREFMNGLADAIDREYEAHLQNLIRDPWELREAYVDVLLGNRAFG